MGLSQCLHSFKLSNNPLTTLLNTSAKMNRQRRIGGQHSGRSQRNLACHTLTIATATRFRSKPHHGGFRAPIHQYTQNLRPCHRINTLYRLQYPCTPLEIPCAAVPPAQCARWLVGSQNFSAETVDNFKLLLQILRNISLHWGTTLCT